MSNFPDGLDPTGYPDLVVQFFLNTKSVKFENPHGGGTIYYAPMWKWIRKNGFLADYLNDLAAAYTDNKNLPLTGNYDEDSKARGLRKVANRWQTKYKRETGKSGPTEITLQSAPDGIHRVERLLETGVTPSHARPKKRKLEPFDALDRRRSWLQANDGETRFRDTHEDDELNATKSSEQIVLARRRRWLQLATNF